MSPLERNENVGVIICNSQQLALSDFHWMFKKVFIFFYLGAIVIDQLQSFNPAHTNQSLPRKQGGYSFTQFQLHPTRQIQERCSRTTMMREQVHIAVDCSRGLVSVFINKILSYLCIITFYYVYLFSSRLRKNLKGPP